MEHPDRNSIKKHLTWKTLDKIDLPDIKKTLCPIAEHTFFSSTHRIFSKIDHMLGNKIILKKLKKIKIIPTIFSNYSGMKLETSSTWKLNKILLNNQCAKEEIKKEFKKYLDTNENENTTSKTCRMQEKHYLEESL